MTHQHAELTCDERPATGSTFDPSLAYLAARVRLNICCDDTSMPRAVRTLSTTCLAELKHPIIVDRIRLRCQRLPFKYGLMLIDSVLSNPFGFR